MPRPSRNNHTIALDRTCELAEFSAGVYASLSERAVDSDVAARLFACARARSQAANDLIVARQQSDDLPGNRPGTNALQSSAMKLDNLAGGDTEAMCHSLRDMDLEVRDAAREALREEDNAAVIEALQSLMLSLEQSVTTLESG